ncbi:PQQ-dependent sugar dehydrogenase [Chitinibacter sp. ZOR0017]|uniref:PQQ-dependent sugar dehydrogenase n=1 Tax=Chitinibacter sp. ZOR0017 TaxID=1339254 RepID=UPI000648BCD7|nr:PQQ-dependent sugar dehydrogenase [Chitinibacter sp. ZOR0017]
MSRLLFAAVLAAIALPTLLQPTQADVLRIASEKHPLQVSILAQGLAHPWGLAFLPDGRMLVTERPGRLRLISRSGELDPRSIGGLPPIAVIGQGGLLDVAVHPDFARNRWVYLAYSGPEGQGYATQVVRGRLSEGAAGPRLDNLQQIYRQRPGSSAGQHFGARLAFDPQGFLYITQGDRGDMQRAQRPDDLAGKIIRLHDDGRFPADNPWASSKDARAMIYSLGNRNVQGAAIHPRTGELWATEHGPQGGDELNIIRAGRNYGWPVITYGRNYGLGTAIGEGTHKSGMTQPQYQWTPSIAPSGLAFYQGNAFPGWRGNLLLGALKYQMLVRLELDGERVVHEERLLKDQFGRIRDVRVGPDGLVYLLTDEDDGKLLQLAPAAD